MTTSEVIPKGYEQQKGIITPGYTIWVKPRSRTTLFKYDNGEWGVSSNQVWVKGLYATASAALYAVSMCPTKLANLWNKQCPKPLTLEDLKEDAFTPLLNKLEAREKLLKNIAELLISYEDEYPEDNNTVGCIVTIGMDEENYDYNGDGFLKWSSKWEVRKVKREEC